jgi:hypothetical protein
VGRALVAIDAWIMPNEPKNFTVGEALVHRVFVLKYQPSGGRFLREILSRRALFVITD